MRNLNMSMVGLVVLGAFASANAEDFAPPSWANKPLTVWADWDYLGTPLPQPPSNDNWATNWGNAGPGPNDEQLWAGLQQPVAAVLQVDDFEAVEDGWKSLSDDAMLHYNLPNYIDMEPFKWVRVEFTYLDPDATGKTPFVNFIEFFDPTLPSDMDSFDPEEAQATMTVWQTPSLPDMKGQIYEDWILVPNPDWEIIAVTVPSGIVLQETFIHTISIPEPATLGLLALGGLALIRRRRTA
jgi:hypothetical protein